MTLITSIIELEQCLSILWKSLNELFGHPNTLYFVPSTG